MKLSISRRLILWLTGPLILMFLAGGLADYLINVAPAITASELRLAAAVRLLAERVQAGDYRAQALSEEMRNGDIKYAIRDSRQRLLGGDSRLPAIDFVETSRQIVTAARIGDRDMRLLTKRFATTAGPVTITAGEWIAENQPATRLSFIGTSLLDFIQLDITLVLVWFGIRIGLRPLRRLSEEIESRSPNDLRPLAEAQVPAEIAPLTATLNRLLGKVNDALHAQQLFVANAAHQLRTPIAGILSQLDLLAEDPAGELLKPRLAVLRQGVWQLAHSTDQLLTLARAETASMRTARNRPVELDALVRGVAARFVDRALAASIDLGVKVAPVMILADAGLLEDVVANLLDNALKYTECGGLVTVNAGVEDGEPFVEVDDNGRGIHQAERLRVRSRFYRSPGSPGHGSGLGLTIVDEIATLYGASLTILPGSSGGGTRVRVQFPGRCRLLP